jgi:hypothetical protein
MILGQKIENFKPEKPFDYGGLEFNFSGQYYGFPKTGYLFYKNNEKTLLVDRNGEIIVRLGFEK